jgi:hypothetical protein
MTNEIPDGVHIGRVGATDEEHPITLVERLARGGSPRNGKRQKKDVLGTEFPFKEVLLHRALNPNPIDVLDQPGFTLPQESRCGAESGPFFHAAATLFSEVLEIARDVALCSNESVGPGQVLASDGRVMGDSDVDEAPAGFEVVVE